MTAWLSAAEITSKVRRRRVRRSLAAGVVVLAVAGTITGLVVGNDPRGAGRNQIAGNIPSARSGSHVGDRIGGAVELVANSTPLGTLDPAAATAVSGANEALTIALLKRATLLTDDGGSPNVSISPFSLYLALGMLENGAAGETASQIAKALQANGISLAAQNTGLEELTSTLAAEGAKDGITLQSANSLWQQQGFALKPAFLGAMASYFHSGVWQVDFANHPADAVKALNSWTSQHTHGKITKLFDALDPATVLVLANALYFHAAWATPFDAANTEPAPFRTAAGKTVTPKFMAGQFHGTTTTTYAAASLPYTGGRFEALAVMPNHGSLSSFVTTLGTRALGKIAKTTEAASAIATKIPRFTTTSSMDLIPAMKALGMIDAFGAADFSNLSTARNLSVDQIRQRVYLGVGEKGTTAAAVTGVSVTMSALGPAATGIVFDHPFLFLIRDRTTGAILFATEVNDPTAS
jgi:serpin B